MIGSHKYFHWYYYQNRNHLFFNIGLGIFIWLFLGLTLPFGLYENNLSNTFQLFLFLLPFGLIWPLIAYGVEAFYHLFGKRKLSESPALDFKFYLLKLFILVHTYFIFRNFMCDWKCVDGAEYLELWFACLLMFLLFYIPFSLYARYRYFRNMVGGEKGQESHGITVSGEGKNTLEIIPDQVIFIKSDDNYVEIVQADKTGGTTTTVFRARLKSVARQLHSHSQFIRVHRSYLVNLQFLEKKGQRDSVLLKYGTWTKEIPVSRKYKQEVLDLINS